MKRKKTRKLRVLFSDGTEVVTGATLQGADRLRGKKFNSRAHSICCDDGDQDLAKYLWEEVLEPATAEAND